jgi:uncharacterized FAD-dependent dehydrogenase
MRMKWMRCLHEKYVENSNKEQNERNKLISRIRHSLKDYIKMHLKEIGCRIERSIFFVSVSIEHNDKNLQVSKGL